MKTSSPPLEPERPAPMSAVKITELNDPTSVGESVQAIAQDVVKLSSSPLKARRVEVRLGDCLLLFHSTNLPVRTRTSLHAGFVAFTVFGPDSFGTVNGLPLGADQILASVPGIEVELIVAAGYESVAFLLPPDLIRDHVVRRQLEDEFHIPYNITLLTPYSSGAGELYQWGRRLIDIASRQPDVFDFPQVQSAGQAELLEKLLATIGSARHIDPSPHDLTQQGHSRIVQIAENYALSHAAERIHVTDLCEAAGVSERTLQYAFKELLGMTPMAFLTRLRLHRARQTLQVATHASTTVAKEAIRWGFWHFSDFSRAYKECFGELPSDTLRRQSDIAELSTTAMSR
jgi:AraC family ethanolamine operon transcriptional activator